LDEATTLAPLSSDAALKLLLNQVGEALPRARWFSREAIRIGKTGAYMQPTILTDVTPDNPAYRQEFFGPVALFFTAKDEDEAVAIANDSPYGLGGSVYTSDIEHGKQVASRIETGMVFINYPSMSAPDLPFGGIKRSGYGKELSNLGIEEFVNKKIDLGSTRARACVIAGTFDLREWRHMKILVTGATGFIGGAVARKLLQQGHQVVAMSQTEDAFAKLRAAGMTPVIGDFANPASLVAPVTEVDAVVSLASIGTNRGDSRELRQGS